jgi:biopolymer transport protein ExbD/biopolymer transport protein TolR
MKSFCNLDASALAVVGFVLLVVMMASSPVPYHGFPGDLPHVRHAVAMPGANREDAMVISVMRDGVVYFGVDRVSPEQLRSKILDRLQEHTVEPRVYIRADGHVRYRTVKEVLDGVRSAGIERVAFLVDQRRPPSSSGFPAAMSTP